MSVRVVDAFVRRYAGPVLQDAGFRNRGRKYMVDGPHGRRAILEFQPEVDASRTSLSLAYGVTTPAHRQFRESRGIVDDLWPYANYALLYRHLWSPEFARTGAVGHVFSQTWVLGDGEHTAEVGVALARGLQHEVLPQIAAWFDPEIMARTTADPPLGVFCGLAPQARARAVALLDVEGAERDMAETLARLPADDMVRRWVEKRLADPPGRC